MNTYIEVGEEGICEVYGGRAEEQAVGSQDAGGFERVDGRCICVFPLHFMYSRFTEDATRSRSRVACIVASTPRAQAMVNELDFNSHWAL